MGSRITQLHHAIHAVFIETKHTLEFSPPDLLLPYTSKEAGKAKTIHALYYQAKSLENWTLELLALGICLKSIALKLVRFNWAISGRSERAYGWVKWPLAVKFIYLHEGYFSAHRANNHCLEGTGHS